MENKSNFILSVMIILLSGHFSLQSQVPSFLKKYKEQYNQDARAANLQWFKDARFGMFIHYGLYSQLGKGEWVQLRDTIPLEEYARLKNNFTASGFDALLNDYNLLLNIGPLPDGSVHPEDIETLSKLKN